MTWYPSATKKPISGTSRARVQKDLLCLHTMVGALASTWNYFNRADVGVYSHVGIGGIWGADKPANLDGVAWQMADTDYRAAANLDGNWRIISVETADNAERPIAPWTPMQQLTIVRIMVDAHRLDGIPLVLVPDSKPGRRGICYHRMGCDPYRVAGGELWSSAYGKDCPTEARIRQIPGLIKRAQAIVNGTVQEDDMSAADIAAMKKDVHDTVLRAVKAGLDGAPNSEYPASELSGWDTVNLKARMAELGGRLDGLETKLDQVLAALAPKSP